MKLSEGVDEYLLRRRSSGLAFERAEPLIKGLCKHVGDVDFDQLQARQISTYLDASRTSTITWRTKYQMLLRFLEFWFYRGAMPALPMPPPKPPARQTFVPHVFSRLELRALLKATVRNQKPIRTVAPQTLRAFILLLYGTGARVGEVLYVLRKDVDLRKGLITFRSTNPGRSRSIPISSDLKDVLKQYLSWRSRANLLGDNLFVTKFASPVSRNTMVVNFQRLRHFAKVTGGDGLKQQPRLDDLRYAFAVHRITSWIKGGADLNRMLPAMAAYMGQKGLGATERYLAMTPMRFQKSLDKLSPTHSRGKWRNDPKLMKFLADL